MLRAFLCMASKGGFSAFRPGHAHIVRAVDGPHLKLVQQHSGDWTMTGKVPVARV